MPDRCTPEYERVVAAMGAALPYRRALALLEAFFPLGDAPAVETTRQRTLQVGARLERAALAPPRPPAAVPAAGSIALGIDGGHVRAVRSYQMRSFEVLWPKSAATRAGLSSSAACRPRRTGSNSNCGVCCIASARRRARR